MNDGSSEQEDWHVFERWVEGGRKYELLPREVPVPVPRSVDGGEEDASGKRLNRKVVYGRL
jgi:hypothetical protein